MEYTLSVVSIRASQSYYNYILLNLIVITLTSPNDIIQIIYTFGTT